MTQVRHLNPPDESGFKLMKCSPKPTAVKYICAEIFAQRACRVHSHVQASIQEDLFAGGQEFTQGL